MHRFSRHPHRSVQTLDGIWDFSFLGDQDADALDLSGIEFSDRMAVPGCFDATPSYAGKRGLAAYRTRVVIPDHTPYRLVFDSVHHWCRVYLNGRLLTEHAGGFTRFQADMIGQPPGETDLVVIVDNRFDKKRNPLHQEYYDWYQYGGISRSVSLHRLGNLWIDALQVTTEDLHPARIRLKVKYTTLNPGVQALLKIQLNHHTLLEEKIPLSEKSGQIERRLELPELPLWTPENPCLQRLQVQLGEDVWQERIGLRTVRVKGQQILINDQPTHLLGINRHEAHPQFGHALPDEILVSDVQQLKDLGCNFVRGSHYPQDERFLDLCDEAGILVWCEATGWQHSASDLTDPDFLAAQLNNIEEMVAVAYNHPSVILWGVLNESQSHDPDNRPAYMQLLGRLRQLDSGRLLTYATCFPFQDVCLDLVDVVSVNTYPGWYHGEIEDIPAFLDHLTAHLDENGQSEKPLILSEIGAGAIPGWRDMNQTRWSEQYQAKLMEVVIKTLFIERHRFAGLGIWQFCDCRTPQLVSKILGRPRGFNNKGITDEYRRPKLAYQVVKDLYHKINYFAIATNSISSSMSSSTEATCGTLGIISL